MVKVKYKELSPEMERLAAPSQEWTGRSSIGMEEKVGEYYFFPLKNLKPYRNQARRNFDENELIQLADTIKEHGVRQPLSVIKSSDDDGMFEVVSGERRLRAARLAGLETVPCFIIKDKVDTDEIALIENIQREDLHPIELGEAYSKIIEDKKHGGITELAIKIGKSISSVSECLKFSKLPNNIKLYLLEKNIRSKIICRRLTKAKNIDEMNNILGIGEGNNTTISKNILRINFDGINFQIESKSIKTLDTKHKNLLKTQLTLLINSL